MENIESLTEIQLSEFVFNHIMKGLKKINKSINDEFNYDVVIAPGVFVDGFSIDKFTEIMQSKRKGKYEISEDPSGGYRFMFTFKSIY